MNDKCHALVLAVNDYRENDIMANVLTDDYGFLTIIMKGAKKITSNNRLFPLNLYELIIDYKDHKTLYQARQIKILKSFYDEDFVKMAFKNIIIDVCLKSQHLENNLYNEVIFCLSKDNFLAYSIFLSHLCRHFGIKPYVDGCVICDDTKVIALDNRSGGFVCAKHCQTKIGHEVKRLRKFRIINKADYQNYDCLKVDDYDFDDFKLVLEFFLENSGLQLKSYNFYLKIKQ